ncbi:hypothetical protein PQR08_18695 [Caballeronia jiangsuensis]|uniref:Uncharacterized protein n=1 Tax=Caballeronia jiangsuensis TaxID=1458357 RepID=A0ABW9CPF5_9BURK
MFDRDFEQLRRRFAGGNRLGGDLDRIELCVDLGADRVPIRAHFVERRPVGRLIGRQSAVHRIDAEREKLVVGGIRARQVEEPLIEQIAIEGF